METVFAGISLACPLVNAAGSCKTIEEVEQLAKTPVGAITVGSITMERRELNVGDTYWMDPEGRYSLNSLGLPNGGMPYYEKALPRMRELAHATDKPLIVSVAGFSPKEYHALASFAAQWADQVELNLGCSNVWGEGGQKTIFSYEPVLVDEVLQELKDPFFSTTVRVTVKLSPLPPNLLSQTAEVLNGSRVVRGVVASNTWPNGFGWDGTKTAITPGGGKAGFAGPGFKGIALGQVVQFRELLRSDIDLMGAGGVQCGKDVQDYRLAGAKAVGINTAFANRGAKVFSNIVQQYVELCPA
ncbi:MAG: dihydroorotate dehydrogenase [Candidatus Yanofskybacteria bacterium]|nr:dihydroorotate dehydrogenase [Candidatus Yanofskybacteria bacterium]